VKYLIIADIHSNLEAFQTVLDDANKMGGFERVWCLGDVVGYGPDPAACIKMLQELKPVCISGNHDLAALDKIDISDFNADAARANRWTADQLSDEDRAYLDDLPEVVWQGDFTLAHGSPRYPAWEYITNAWTATENFKHFSTPYCLVGHTHVPFVFEQEDILVNEGYLGNGDMLVLGEKRLIVNPGGVGQPRDRDPRASYAIYDSDERVIRHYRVEYPIGLTQEKMENAGLPDFLIGRLGWGI